MSRKIWFAYMTTSHEGRGAPGIYYDDLPNHKGNRLHNDFMAPPVDISHLATGPDGEVTASFAELCAAYPLPPIPPVAKTNLDAIEVVEGVDVTNIVNAAMAESMQG